MALSGKKIKRLLIILALIAVSAWFWGNAALQLCMYRSFTHAASLGIALNELPEKLELDEQDIEGEDLHFYGFTVRMPFLKKATASVNHGYMWGQVSIIYIHLYENDKFDATVYITDYQPDAETVKLIQYAKLSDMSWWNLRGNWRLMLNLTMKAMGRASYADGYYNVYDVETPYVKGYLVEAGNDRLISESFVFTLDNRSYSINILSRKGQYGLRNLIGSIRPAKDEERSYGEASALAANNPGYPEELLLLSQISIRGPVEKHQKEYILKGLEESLEHALNPSDGEKDEDYVERIRNEIAELKEAIEEDP